MAASTDTIPGAAATAAGAFSDQQLATQLAGLDALDQAAHRQSASLAPPRVAGDVAEARRDRPGLVRVAGRGVERLAPDLRAARSDHGPRTVLAGPRRARDVEGRRDDAAARRGRLRVGGRRRGHHRARGLAVQVVAHCSRLAHHRPADDAVDRVVPPRALALPVERGSDHVRRRHRRRAVDRQRSHQRHRPRAAAAHPGGPRARRPRTHRLPPRDHPRGAADVPHRAEAGMGVRVAKPHGGRAARDHRQPAFDRVTPSVRTRIRRCRGSDVGDAPHPRDRRRGRRDRVLDRRAQPCAAAAGWRRHDPVPGDAHRRGASMPGRRRREDRRPQGRRARRCGRGRHGDRADASIRASLPCP